MTTQATIKITQADGHSIYLDRFTDGSLAMTGADVYQAAKLAYETFNPYSPENPPHIIATNYLLAQISPANSFESAQPLYRLIGRIDLDTEHFYHIDCEDGCTFIDYATGYIGPELDQMTNPYNLSQFRTVINEDRHTVNRALAALAAADDYYGNHSPFPDLE